MTPQQQAALEGLVGRVLTQGEIDSIAPMVAARTDGLIAESLSLGRIQLSSRHITERGVRALNVLPRHRMALLTVLKDAEVSVPGWFVPTLTAIGVPAADHAALSDDIKSAYYWLKNADGLDIGASGARGMLDIIAAAVPDAAPACVAVKALAELPNPISVNAVSDALNNIGV